MSWYTAKIIFKILTKHQNTVEQFDEHLRLIEANSQEEAILKARIIGIQEENSFMIGRTRKVLWEFVNISDLQELRELQDGAELYSHVVEKNKSEDFIHAVHSRAVYLQKTH